MCPVRCVTYLSGRSLDNPCGFPSLPVRCLCADPRLHAAVGREAAVDGHHHAGNELRGAF